MSASASWWGTVWTSALTQAFNEAIELETGARLARRLDASVEVAPGSMTLRDPADGWVAHLGLKQLDDGQWETLLRTVAADPQLMAAVITGELPLELHGKAVALGCSFAPEASDIGADCSCPDWHDPCRHVGALVAKVAEMIDADPWLLVMLRGRSRDDVAGTIRRLRSAQRGVEWVDEGDEPRGADPGVAAAAALRSVAKPLPSPLPPLRRAGGATAHLAPPADAGVEQAELERLVADAASRAFELLGGNDGGDGLALSVEHDLARIVAAGDLDDGAIQRMATAAGMQPDEVRRMAVGWALAGSDGVDAVCSTHEATPQQIARGAAALGEARPSRNSVTAGTTRLMIDEQGRWWRLTPDDQLGWTLADGPASDPVDVL